MHTTLRRALTTVAAAAIALGTVALQPAEARKRHHHNHQAGAVILGTFATLALIAAANQNGYPYEGYSMGYQGYPYGPGYPYYWNGYRYVPGYGPGYGGPVPPDMYHYHR
jgi:hypothetical protein